MGTRFFPGGFGRGWGREAERRRSEIARLGETAPAPCGIVPAMAKSPFSLDGKHAIVTGGGTRIGQTIPIEFAKAGAHVPLCSRKLEHLEPVVKAIPDLGRRSFAMAVDLRQEDQG